ncbi:hypothetical protein ENTCAN_07097 [Enterobacter cancerogenus ATCC 35316]|nr:hypothetical protein ENTCAN_07097 [Enterobacter cancerogenus ATCC 35316]
MTLRIQHCGNSVKGAETVKLFCDEDRLSWGIHLLVVVVMTP